MGGRRVGFGRRAALSRSVLVAGLLSACWVLALPGAALPAGQGPSELPGPDSVVRPVRVDEAPRIDGRLDEPLWSEIEPINELYQIEPRVGEPVSERTDVFVAYDENYLYFGIRAFDREPDRIVSRMFERDSNLDADDSISIAIDSLNTNRTAFAFQTNILGTQRDLELSEAGAFNMPWDTIWYSKGNQDELGYTLEIAIPWFALRFQPSETNEMGLLVERIIRRKNEKANWPFLSRDYSFINVSQYARMVGLEGIKRGVGVELKPYATGGYSQVPDEELWDADAGIDAKWGITSNLTADLTVNPDFAQVESDALQINLTRFSLFYPERRDFFLESADLFSFGLPREAEVFFSRRVGIRGGQEVPIIAGGRTYGLAGSTNLGLMTMQTQSTDDFNSENFTVARVRQNVLGRSYVGGIFTSRYGDPTQEDITWGGDARFIFGVNSRIEAAVAQSNRPDVDTDNMFVNVSASQNYDLYDWIARYTEIGENFNPGIGFMRRRDMRRILGNFHYKPRPGWRGVRQLTFGMLYGRVETRDGELDTQLLRPGFLTTFQTEDVLTVFYIDAFERVPWPFPIAPGVFIPAGEYKSRQGQVEFASSPSRWWFLGAGSVAGSFYDGDLFFTGFNLSLQPIPRIRATINAEYDNVDVPTGSFDSLISRLYFSYFFSPALTTRLGVQHSSLYDDFVLNFRIRWIYQPGSEAWIVYDEGRQFGAGFDSLRDRAFIVKIVHNFRF